jgi:hypothetical protein
MGLAKGLEVCSIQMSSDFSNAKVGSNNRTYCTFSIERLIAARAAFYSKAKGPQFEPGLLPKPTTRKPTEPPAMPN